MAVKKSKDVISIIYKIRVLLDSITDEDFEELNDMVEGQITYNQPLKIATTQKSNMLGQYNKKVVDSLKDLKKIFDEGRE